MPDTPQPASKKRKAISCTPESSAYAPPKKKQKIISARASAKPKDAAPTPTTPSTRIPVLPSIPSSAPPGTRSRRLIPQASVAGPSTQPLPPPGRRRVRPTRTAHSPESTSSSDTGDSTPPPITALRRSSSGRVIISTPKVTAANESIKLSASAKSRSSRRKRKSPPTTTNTIELYSSGEDEKRRGLNGKIILAKRQRNRKVAEIIDLCSDDEPSPSPVKTPTVHISIDDDVVTILSSGDDRPPVPPTRNCGSRASRPHIPSLTKGKGRRKATLRSQKDDESALDVALTRSTSQPDIPELPRNLSPTSLVVPAYSENFDDVLDNFKIANTQQQEYQSIRKHNADPNAEFSTCLDHCNPYADHLSPSTDPPSMTVTQFILPTQELNNKAEPQRKNASGNSSLQERSETENDIPPTPNTTPLFLPPLDEEEKYGKEGSQLPWEDQGPFCISPSEKLAVGLQATTSPPEPALDEDAGHDNNTYRRAREPSIQLGGDGTVSKSELMGNLAPSQSMLQSDEAELDKISITPESRPTVAVYTYMEGSELHQLAGKKQDTEEKDRRMNSDHQEVPGRAIPALLEQEIGHTGDIKATDPLNKIIPGFSVPENGDSERTHLSADPIARPQLILSSSLIGVNIDGTECLSSLDPHQRPPETTQTEGLLRSYYQPSHRTPSYINPNIIYPSDPSILLSHLRLHTPRFFSHSFVLPTNVKEKAAEVQQEERGNVNQQSMATQSQSFEATPEILAESRQSADEIKLSTAAKDVTLTSPNPTSLSQVQSDALTPKQERRAAPNPTVTMPEDAGEVVMEVTTEFLKSDPTLASVWLESNMFMGILRDAQQEIPETKVFIGQVEALDESTPTPTYISVEYVEAPQDLPNLPHKPPSGPKEASIQSPASEDIQNSNTKYSTPEPTTPPEHEPDLSPSSLNSSSTLQDSPLPPTPNNEERAVADADTFFIRSESPSAFNPDVFAAILGVASPAPLAKEEDDYFSTHFFDYPEDLTI